jgi:hypothetical protein
MNTGDSFVVTGGNKLHGTLTPQGQKMKPYKFCVPLYSLKNW